ncbi:MAG: hypothetical protein WB822_22065 [Rhodoplanes sp.]
MTEPRKLHELWMEQCEAAGAIKERYDYLVGEKLLNFTEAASEHRAFAQELPRFVSAVRQMFSAEEIAAHLARIEHEQREFERDQREIECEQRENNDVAEEEAAIPESPKRKKARAQQFAMIKELLTAPVLGTS